MNNTSSSRRWFLAQTAATSGALLTNHIALSQNLQPRPKVAAIFTVLRFRSHAYNILENFLGPYYFNGSATIHGSLIPRLTPSRRRRLFSFNAKPKATARSMP